MVGRCHQQIRIVEERSACELRLATRVCPVIVHGVGPVVELEDDRQVELVLTQRCEGLVRLAVAETDLGPGVALQENAVRLRREGRGSAREGPEAQPRVSQSADDLELRLCLREARRYRLRMETQGLSRLGQRHSSRGPGEENDLRGALEGAHLLRHGRRCQRQGFRCGGEAARPCDLQQRLEPAHIQHPGTDHRRLPRVLRPLPVLRWLIPSNGDSTRGDYASLSCGERSLRRGKSLEWFALGPAHRVSKDRPSPTRGTDTCRNHASFDRSWRLLSS